MHFFLGVLFTALNTGWQLVGPLPVSAYNSVPEQTDETPCIGAEGTNICELYQRGEQICAANFVPLGTKLHLKNLGTCTVRDRMNARYFWRVDWYLGSEVEKAKEFGVQYLDVWKKQP